MYRRLISFALAVCAVALTALLIPLTLAARDIAQVEELAEAAGQARRIASQWERDATPDEAGELTELTGDATGDITLFPPSGPPLGPAPHAGAASAIALAQQGAAVTTVVDGWGYAATPALFADGTGVVLVGRSPAQLREDLWPRLATIAVVSVALLGLSALAAWRLARHTVAPLTDLAGTAHAVADGDLAARASASGVPEIDQVAHALNRLTTRVRELLQEERAATAELAHQLRTPLTVLSVDVDAVTDQPVRERLRDDVDALQRMADEIISTARRPSREGLIAQCDAVAVVTDRVRFWRVLAEDQHRDLTAVLPVGPLGVRLTADDLAAAVDIMLQNVFVHTPEGTAFAVAVRDDGELVRITVSDEGAGPEASTVPAPGSTGLGLSIATRLAEASGGGLSVDGSNGTVVTVSLGRGDDA